MADLIQTDLEAQDYAVGKAVFGACSVGAPHIRQRLYFVANSLRGASQRRTRSIFGAEATSGDAGWPPQGVSNNPVLVCGTASQLLMPTLFEVPGLEAIWTRMVKEYKGEQPGYTMALRALMIQAITVMYRHMLEGSLSANANHKIEPAIQAMQLQPDYNWSVAELAALCGYHPIHFSKLFKEEAGLTPKHFIIRERIKRAKQALLLGEKMESLSIRLGFKSIHYFSHQFKEVTGLTPSQFRMLGQTKKTINDKKQE